MSLFYRVVKPFDRRLEDAPDSNVASSARTRLESKDLKYGPGTVKDYVAKHPERVTRVVESP